ncbi:GDSL esterase/lipase [Hibiscus syriacus]|uniref:GDSL esterase/lipase n=1 Tax=Hibiscus syriacus TaxID=106335 RepID=A0A6A2YYS1_HIBSY|nr:GDSL esterase/lipase [Hibiscus syriacus]
MLPRLMLELSLFSVIPLSIAATTTTLPRRLVPIHRLMGSIIRVEDQRGGQKIGLSESPLPFLSPDFNGKKLLIGANFASAGVGILNDTGVQFVNILRMYRQLELFQEYKQRLSGQVGSKQSRKLINQALVNQALVLITVGGNDFVNNYYLVPYSASKIDNNILKTVDIRLYKLGARRVLVTGTGPMGCVPTELAMRGKNGGCSEQSPTCSNIACCGQGPYNGLDLCTQLSKLCPNRALYAFWDPFHPSEKANRLIVEQIMTGSNEYMHPMNLSTIMAMDSRI